MADETTETPTQDPTAPTSAQLWDGLVKAMTAERTWAARHRRTSVAVGYLAGVLTGLAAAWAVGGAL